MPLPSDVAIRDARPDELDALADVTAAAYAEYMPGDEASPERKRAFEEYAREIVDVRDRIAQGAVIIVAERAGRLIGNVSYYPPGVDKSGGGWPSEIAAIRLLAVLPSERGRSIGRALTEETIRRARAARAPAFGLHTTELMAVARAMYLRMGFVRVPEHDFRPAPDLLVEGYRLEL